jgi:hypothetical protein
MTARLSGTQLWQQNLASLIRSGLYSKAATGEANGLFTVVGIYTDETCSAPLAKYSDSTRAADAAIPVNAVRTTGSRSIVRTRPENSCELIAANPLGG